MADMAASPIPTLDIPAVEATADAPLLRCVGYCAGCGTWDEHGMTCVTCGYDFAGGDGTSAAL